MFEYSTRSPGTFSHRQPPCMVCETITTGACAARRSSTAPSMNVCVPPPDSPVQASRFRSTSGRDSRKSSARMLSHVWSPIRLIFQSRLTWFVANWVHSPVYDDHRPHQLHLRLPHFRGTPLVVPRFNQRAAVPDRMVRGISRHADAGSVCDPDGGQPNL